MTTTDSNKAMPFEGLHEECGVFGMYDFDGGDVASSIYYGLFALQHRGQEKSAVLPLVRRADQRARSLLIRGWDLSMRF